MHFLEGPQQTSTDPQTACVSKSQSHSTKQEVLAGLGSQTSREDATQMTKQMIRKICQESGLYQRPELNTKLYLHRRGFKKIENLEEYTEVQALWLGGNGIRRLENLHPLSKLKCLFLGQNGLTCIENLDSCPELVVLDLSENSICRIEGLEKLKRLSSFKIARNKLTSLSDILGLRRCPSLTNVDMSYNSLCFHDEIALPGLSVPHENSCSALISAPSTPPKEGETSHEDVPQHDKTYMNQTAPSGCHVKVESSKKDRNGISPTPWPTAKGAQPENSIPNADESRGFVECFKSLPGLATLCLMGNPVTRQIVQYRRTLIANLPALRYLDDRPVKEVDHEAALAWFRGGWEEEQKVIRAHKEREQETLRGHVSTLRRLQEAHRQKINMALERISREAAERQKTCLPQIQN